MNNREYYLSLPHDMSGSLSKNRFRMELLWGISKMLDIYESGDFTMVFDYACDIELHFRDGFEFYQIKTHSSRKSYTCKTLTKIKGEGSILGKLYVLNDPKNIYKIKMAVVTNSPLSISKTAIKNLEYCFENLPSKDKEQISADLQEELHVEKVDFSKLFYIYTDMNIAEPQNEIMGKLTITFEKIKKCEPQNPNALYRLIYETVVEKACYEYSGSEYEDIVAHKGLTRSEFDEMLDAHASSAKTGIPQTEAYIESLQSITLKRRYKKGLTNMLNAMSSSHILKKIAKEVTEYLIAYDEEGHNLDSIESGISLLERNFDENFPVEYSREDKIVFYIIMINRFIEGVYDN